jgi:Secretion system C-terminal sorting domain
MKKIYLSILAVSALCTTSLAQTAPTCSLNPIFLATNKVGIFPDSATNFISGNVGSPYVQNITIRIPKDTTSSSILFCFNRFELTTPTGTVNYNLPPGLNMGSSTAALANGTVNGAPSLLFPGNTNQCGSIYGTPTVAGTYTLALKVTTFLTPQPFGSCSSTPNITGGSSTLTPPQLLNYYIIKINPPVGVQELGKDKMALYQNSPNPFSSLSEIKFYVEDESDATITVYNTLGSIVNQQTIKTNLGENSVMINASNLASGTYVYSLKYKGAITSKRMMVINN